ncbi:MAG TPA: TetR family transcriptional regulator [Bryobacteraceae bacterium]|nr:TetR family transcriptional regulator [Bryobacteraceae bacterium]
MTQTNVSLGSTATLASEPEAAQGKDTKDRILDAAESLFVAHGFQATSLRRITALARVNLGAVNYHFQSKEHLIQAVVTRKLEPINNARLELLDQLEAQATPENPPTLEQVLVAFLKPVTDAQSSNADLGSFPVLMGRLYAVPGGVFQRFFASAFSVVARRFKEAITRTLPGARPIAVLWGMHLTIGAMAHYLARPPVLALLAGRDAAPDPKPDEALDRMVSYMAGGIRAMVAREEARR